MLPLRALGEVLPPSSGPLFGDCRHSLARGHSPPVSASSLALSCQWI